MTHFLNELQPLLPVLIQLSGWCQIILILGSLGIPTVLGWKEKLTPLSTLIRQMFWVYSLYIWCTNLSFGLLSAFGAPYLLDGTPLATCVTGFIFGYWLLRMIVQWTYFDISEIPQTPFNVAAKWLLELLFLGLMLVYGLAFIHNLGWI